MSAPVSPDAAPATPGKAPVLAKVGSLNSLYSPAKSTKKIFSEKKVYNASSKIGSLDNIHHHASGGDKKIQSTKLDFNAGAHSKVGSLENLSHKPTVSKKVVLNQKLHFKETASPKVEDGARKKSTGSLAGKVGRTNERMAHAISAYRADVSKAAPPAE
ncbi:hypothetical protein HKX48_006473 [Thoreauomyces humboldtii]|nr:hypothetical protein HKX48_006473 [Thoreauomyces humboldtii]